MATSTLHKIRTGNLPQFRLSTRETTFALALVGLANLVFGILIGLLL